MKALVVVLVLVLMLGSAGCIRSAAGAAWQMVNPTEAPTPEITPLPTITTIATPAPVYQEPEELRMYRTNGRWLGEYFSWLRYNVSMQKDLRVRTRVYDYKFLYSMSQWWYEWGRYFTVYPEVGKKYLIIMPYMEMVGTSPEWDPRMYGMNQDHWYIQYRGQLIRPDPTFHLCTRVRELETRPDSQNTVWLQSYGYDWQGGDETCTELSWLRMGASNAWDGFIVYQVPKEARAEDLIVVGRFDGFGQAWWKLQEKRNED